MTCRNVPILVLVLLAIAWVMIGDICPCLTWLSRSPTELYMIITAVGAGGVLATFVAEKSIRLQRRAFWIKIIVIASGGQGSYAAVEAFKVALATYPPLWLAVRVGLFLATFLGKGVMVLFILTWWRRRLLRSEDCQSNTV